MISRVVRHAAVIVGQRNRLAADIRMAWVWHLRPGIFGYHPQCDGYVFGFTWPCTGKYGS